MSKGKKNSRFMLNKFILKKNKTQENNFMYREFKES